MHSIPHTIYNNTFWLSSHRCIFWEKEKALIIADIHFGKTGHFRKSGIAVPQSVFKEDLQKLFSLIQYYQPSKLFIVGDLFHSSVNKEMNLFLKWRDDLPGIHFHLIKGNHDILKDKWYKNAGIEVASSRLQISNFCFVHDITLVNHESSIVNNLKPDEIYFFSGHIHPGIKINGIGKQSVSLPCFYFTEKYAVLPAFSAFTGYAMMDVKKGNKIFAVVNNSVIKL